MGPHTIRYYLWILTIHLDRFASNRAAGWLFKGSAFLGSNQKSHLNHIKPYMYIFRDVDTLDPTKVCFLIEFCLNGIFLSVVDAQRDALYGDIWGISGITQRVSSIAWFYPLGTCYLSDILPPPGDKQTDRRARDYQSG